VIDKILPNKKGANDSAPFLVIFFACCFYGMGKPVAVYWPTFTDGMEAP
jgi:hypothetical protein